MKPTEQEFFTKLTELMERFDVDINTQHNNDEIYINFKSGSEFYTEDSLNPDSISNIIKANIDDEFDFTGFGLKPIGFDKFKALYEGTWEVSKEEYDLNDKRKRERIESEMKKEYLFKDPEGYKEFHKPIVIKHEEKIKSLAKACRETQRNVYQNIVNKSFTGYEIEEIEEPELNEESISKLCDDLIEAKKEPLSASQIIDKYARRD